jgi:hypothetical protein
MINSILGFWLPDTRFSFSQEKQVIPEINNKTLRKRGLSRGILAAPIPDLAKTPLFFNLAKDTINR